MTSWRSSCGDAIDRQQPLSFRFDDTTVQAFRGDTIASALLANDVSIVGRSFKYHRRRGLWGAGVEEPNGIVDIDGPDYLPNGRATTEAAEDGRVVRSVNTSPTAKSDRNAFIDRFSRFIPAAFYYKTFMFPNWHLFEPRIREMAGLGRLGADTGAPGPADQLNHHCDVLVVGGGPAGLAVALAAAQSGKRVTVCDQGKVLGGSFLFREGEVDGMPAADWVLATLGRLSELATTVLPETTAFGIYDHFLVGLSQRMVDGSTRLWRVRPRHIVLATGAIERPLPFANNDLPGVMSSDAALVYLRRYGVVAGRDVVVATNNDSAYETARALREVGAKVSVVDYRQGAQPSHGIETFHGSAIESASGRNRVAAVKLADGLLLKADAVLVSGGFTPTLHLFCQSQGKLAWNEEKLAFLPGDRVAHMSVVGTASGASTAAEFASSFDICLSDLAVDRALLPTFRNDGAGRRPIAAWPRPKTKGRVWIDLQNDVSVKDIELAARENYISVEHLKRYTTLGMATDQGKTSNLNGLALMAAITDRPISEVGTTTYRPPFTPVPFLAFAGHRSGGLLNPLRRLPLEVEHRADDAVLREYGGWLRPAWYGRGEAQDEIEREVMTARRAVALFDGSPLGKIEVVGPQAAEFLDFIYYNTVSNLRPGRCRYGFILNESGVIYDDGVLVRIDENRFIVSCSSSHVAGMHALLEEWRQDRFDRTKLFIHNATVECATFTVSGPQARTLMVAAGIDLDLGDEALPHMATTLAGFQGVEVRVTRVSFTGDRSYEISAPAYEAPRLWGSLKGAGFGLGATLLGMEALLLMRAEKGYIVVGKDSDGMSRPMDFGLTAPLERKKTEYLGRRSLLTKEAQRPDRPRFVGLDLVDAGPPLATGAHGIEIRDGRKHSIGYVTSSYFSPTLGRPIALALIEKGTSRHGEIIDVQHLGDVRRARIVGPCAFDPEGARLNA